MAVNHQCHHRGRQPRGHLETLFVTTSAEVPWRGRKAEQLVPPGAVQRWLSKAYRGVFFDISSADEQLDILHLWITKKMTTYLIYSMHMLINITLEKMQKWYLWWPKLFTHSLLMKRFWILNQGDWSDIGVKWESNGYQPLLCCLFMIQDSSFLFVNVGYQALILGNCAFSLPWSSPVVISS